MERYWIRNRGRVQGPFTVDRIQGLLRRGRFNRHFHVSEDKKEWLPATEFPELFEGVVSQRGGGGDDEEVFQGGGSPFDDDFDAPPANIDRGGRSQRSQSPFDDDDDDDWDEDDEEWEDDYESGGGLVGWIEKNSRPLLLVLIVALAGLGWFVLFRESFAQDEKDLAVLIDAKNQIDRAAAGGIDAGTWSTLNQSLNDSLAPMIERLNETASSQDHVKQEMLFGARDDIPRIFRELPNGKSASTEHLEFRIRIVDQMIKERKRLYDGPPFSPPNQPTPPQTPSEAYSTIEDAAGLAPGTDAASGGESPTSNSTTPNNSTPSNSAPQPAADPGSPTMTPGTPPPSPTGTPSNNPPQQPAPAPAGIPGRPPSVVQ